MKGVAPLTKQELPTSCQKQTGMKRRDLHVHVLDASGSHEAVAIHDAHRASRRDQISHDRQNATTCPNAATKNVDVRDPQDDLPDDPQDDPRNPTRNGSHEKTSHPCSSTRSTSRILACQSMHRPLASLGRLWSIDSSPKQRRLQLSAAVETIIGDKLTLSFIITT